MSSAVAPTFPPDLDGLRIKLVSLIDALTSLQSQLLYLSSSTPQPTTRAPGILPYPDLLNRYNLLLSHVVSLGSLLSSVGDGREVKRGEEGRDKKREVWDGAVVVPASELEEAKDWIVGVLLRTKQVRAISCWQSAGADAVDRRHKSKRTSQHSPPPSRLRSATQQHKRRALMPTRRAPRPRTTRSPRSRLASRTTTSGTGRAASMSTRTATVTVKTGRTAI